MDSFLSWYTSIFSATSINYIMLGCFVLFFLILKIKGQSGFTVAFIFGLIVLINLNAQEYSKKHKNTIPEAQYHQSMN